MSTEIKEVVCALIMQNGQVLIAQRGPDKDQSGKWEFPGGKITEGELTQTALKREIKEELALEITIEKPLTVTLYGYAAFTVRLYPFICTAHGQSPQLTEHTAIEWVSPENILQYDLVPADIPVAIEWKLIYG
jgi:mutator protein MutT